MKYLYKCLCLYECARNTMTRYWSVAQLQLFLRLLSLSLLFFLYFSFSIFISFPRALLCFHTVLLSRCTPWHPGEQWFSNNLCRKPVDLVIEQCKSENNTKGQFSIFPLVGLRFADTPGLVIGTFIMQAMLRDLAPVELALTWVIWQRIKV